MNVFPKTTKPTQANVLELKMFLDPLNHLLASLPQNEYQRILPHLTPVYLKSGNVLWQPFEPIQTVYFPNNALISLVSMMDDGSTTEVALIGHEGMLGLPVIFGGQYFPYEAVVHIEGIALKLDANILKQEFKQKENLYHRLLTYSQARMTQVAQLAACNRQHTIEARLARWLLSVSDCTLSNELPITQELIANMLGIRRSGVTVALGELQKQGAVRCFRGRIIILNKKQLENYSCECYSLIKDEFVRLLETVT